MLLSLPVVQPASQTQLILKVRAGFPPLVWLPIRPQPHTLVPDLSETPKPSAVLQAKSTSASERRKLADELRLERAGRERAEEVLVRQVRMCVLMGGGAGSKGGGWGG
jgi:hypothetical protein